MRASSLRYPKAQIAAGLLTGIVLGYVCSRSPQARVAPPDMPDVGDMTEDHVVRFFSATRRAWGLSRRLLS